MARGIEGLIYLLKSTREDVERKRKEDELYFNHDITLHQDIIRAWLLQSLRSVITSVHCSLTICRRSTSLNCR